MASTTGYEFNDTQNQSFAELAAAMRFVARFQLVAGLIMLAVGAVVALASAWALVVVIVANGAFNAAVGAWVHRAATSFQHVVDTEGSDIAHLMDSVRELSKAFRLQKLLVVALLVSVGGSALWLAMDGGLSGGAPGGAIDEGVHGAPPAPPNAP